MGRVVLVHDERTGRDIALKELLEAEGSTHLEGRFLREARITARLDHPGVVPVFDLGRSAEGRAYYTMRVIGGETLAAQISAARNMRERLALLPKLLDVCQTMGFAHSRGIIHRDLKPTNVMVGEFGETIVLDWGLAKDLERDDDDATLEGGRSPEASDRRVDPLATRDGTTLGTPAYMSPEQALGDLSAVDARTDVWALGAMLYETVSGGHRPLGETDAQAVLVRAAAARVIPLGDVARTAPAELRAICARCLAPAPEDRYPDAAHLARDVEAFLEGQLVDAHRYSRLTLVWRWFRRWWKALALLLVVGACAGVGWLWWLTATVHPGGVDGIAPETIAKLSLGAEDARIRELVELPEAEGNAARNLWRVHEACMAGGCSEPEGRRHHTSPIAQDYDAVPAASLDSPIVDELLEMGSVRGYSMWGEVLIPEPDVGWTRRAGVRFAPIDQVAHLARVRGARACQAGDFERGRSVLVRWMVAGHHLEHEQSLMGFLVGLSWKQNAAWELAQCAEQAGDAAAAAKWTGYVEAAEARDDVAGDLMLQFRFDGVSESAVRSLVANDDVPAGLRSEALLSLARRYTEQSPWHVFFGPSEEERAFLLQPKIEPKAMRFFQYSILTLMEAGPVARIGRLLDSR